MEAERDPLNPVDDDGVAHVHRQDVALRCSVIEMSVNGEVVEIAAKEGESALRPASRR